MAGRHIIVAGNPVNGLEFFGPFSDHDQALGTAELMGGDWWIAELQDL